MILIKINDEVKNENLEDMYEYIEWSKEMYDFFKEQAGKEHYKLISFIAKQFPDGSVFVDVGTAHGHSAIALTSNNKSKVITYDLIDRFIRENPTPYKKTIKNHPRIDFRVKNCLEAKEFDEVKKSPLIFLDVDPHDGNQERIIVNMLKMADYKGVILCDDIHLNEGMRKWWNNEIPNGIKKMDLTKYGHWSGTGALIFDTSFIDIVESS